VGPHLPLDVHYAIGNFLGEALLGGPINLKSDGTAIRSFMYIADAVVCIFKSLLLDINSSHPLHIGSEHALSIKDTAYLIASLTDCEVNLGTNTTTTNSPAPNFYVPSTARTRDLLEVSEWTSILESIEKIIRWLSIKQ
jgi:dTDP-glucose 4,6-dehydratase